MESSMNKKDAQSIHTTAAVQSEPQEQPGAIRIIRYIFAVLASCFAVFVLVQVFFAGLAIFVDASNWGLHTSFVRMFAMLPIVLIVLAFVGRLPRAAIVQSIALFVMIILQFVTAKMAANLSYLSALHPVIALGLFGSSVGLMRLSWKASLKRTQA